MSSNKSDFKNIELSAEEIEQNWERFLYFINKISPGNLGESRSDILYKWYDSIADRVALMPASTRIYYHNCFPGGYIDHVLRVTDYAIRFHEVWTKDFDFEPTYELSELIFAALNHDMGKIGSTNFPCYIDQKSDWHAKRGELYTINPANDFMPVADRSLFLLQELGVSVSVNEMLGIKLHDGLYEEGNRSYYINHSPQAKLRTNLPYVLHQADLTAARYEYTRWLKLNPFQNLSDE